MCNLCKIELEYIYLGFKLKRVNYFPSYRFGYPYFEIIYQFNFLQNVLAGYYTTKWT